MIQQTQERGIFESVLTAIYALKRNGVNLVETLKEREPQLQQVKELAAQGGDKIGEGVADIVFAIQLAVEVSKDLFTGSDADDDEEKTREKPMRQLGNRNYSYDGPGEREI